MKCKEPMLASHRALQVAFAFARTKSHEKDLLNFRFLNFSNHSILKFLQISLTREHRARWFTKPAHGGL
jgi:hypothetical protein